MSAWRTSRDKRLWQRTMTGRRTFRVFVFSWLILTVGLARGASSAWDGVYTDAQATRGEAISAERCASCHAPDLSGMDQAPALTGADFLTAWNGLSMNDLFERTQISMPADKPGSLERQQVADVLAFLLQKNGFHAGPTALSTTADVLKAITVVAKKP
jgi:mono/diheme cytochrome c family protein